MIVANDPEHARAIARAAGCVFNPELDHIICNVQNDRLLGGVIFTGYTGVSMALHCAGFTPRWFNRDMCWITFYYPFVQLGVRKITAAIPSGNHKSLLFTRKLGFVEEARIADMFPNDGALVFVSMTPEQCRWLERGKRG